MVVLEAAGVAVNWSFVQFQRLDIGHLAERLLRLGTALGVTAIGTATLTGVMIMAGKVWSPLLARAAG